MFSSFELCTLQFRVQEFGVYNLNLGKDGTTCSVATDLEPVNPNMALLYSFLMLCGIGIVIQLTIFSSKRGYLNSAKKGWLEFQRKLGFKV